MTWLKWLIKQWNESQLVVCVFCISSYECRESKDIIRMALLHKLGLHGNANHLRSGASPG